jgi:hypothetical protein
MPPTLEPERATPGKSLESDDQRQLFSTTVPVAKREPTINLTRALPSVSCSFDNQLAAPAYTWYP